MVQRQSHEHESQSTVRRMLRKWIIGPDQVADRAIRKHHQWPASTDGDILAGGAVGQRHLDREVREQLTTSTIHHVTVSAVTSQDIAAGGATVQWGGEAGAPNERRGFETFHQQLAAGSVGDIPLDLTGVLEGEFDGRWASHRGPHAMTVTLLRDGAAVGDPVTIDMGPVTGLPFDGPLPGKWNVRQGDHLRVELANGSGSVQTLESLTFVGRIDGTSEGRASTFETPDSWDWTIDGTVPANVESGDLLLYLAGEEYVNATLEDRTHPGWTEVLFHSAGVYFAGYMGWVGCWSKDVTDEQPGAPVGVSVPGGTASQLCLRVPGAGLLNAASETGTGDGANAIPSPVTVSMGAGRWGSLILTVAMATNSASHGQPDGGTTICNAEGSSELAFGYVDTFDGSVDLVWPDPSNTDAQDTVWAAMALEVAS